MKPLALRSSTPDRRPLQPDVGPGAWSHPRRANAAAAVLILLGLAARLQASRAFVRSADEDLHLTLAGSGNWLETYRASLSAPHPPLFFLLLNVWKRIAGTDWELRLLPIACAAGFLWVAYLWIRRLLGKTCALSTLALLSLLPSFLLLTSEIRAYALLLLLLAGAMLALERALEAGKVRDVVAFAALEGLALLTHYSAVFLITSAFLYSAIRIRSSDRRRRFVTAWLASQAALAGLFGLLYVSHISRLRGGVAEFDAQTDWLESSYFHRGVDGGPGFVVRQTLALAQYVFSSRAAGMAALALGLFGLGWLALRRPSVAALLAVPFLACAAAALLDFYPYGGSRHSMVLAPFACVAVASGIGRLSGERPWVPLALTAILLPSALAVAL